MTIGISKAYWANDMTDNTGYFSDVTTGFEWQALPTAADAKLPHKYYAATNGSINRCAKLYKEVEQEESSSPPEAHVRELLEKLRDEDVSVREEAIVALRNMGPAAVPALIEVLEGRDLRMREEALFALGRLGSVAAGAITFLIELLRDEDDWMQMQIARALGNIGPAAEQAIPALAELLNDSNADVRIETAGALLCIISSVEEINTLPRLLISLSTAGLMDIYMQFVKQRAISTLVVELKGGEDGSGIRYSAARGIGRGGAAARWAIPVLIDALDDHYLGVRIQSAASLLAIVNSAKQISPLMEIFLFLIAAGSPIISEELPEQRAIAILIDSLENGEYEARLEAAAALRNMGAAAVVLVPELERLAEDEDQLVKELALRLLSEISDGDEFDQSH